MDKKIMIVDDAMFMRKTIRNALEGGGFSSIVEAADGRNSNRDVSEGDAGSCAP